MDNDKKQKKSGCGFWCIHENCILIVQNPKVKPWFAKFQWKIVIENNPLWIIIKDDVDANCLFQSPLAFWWCSSARHMWWQNYTICKLFNSFFRSFQKKPCYYWAKGRERKKKYREKFVYSKKHVYWNSLTISHSFKVSLIFVN